MNINGTSSETPNSPSSLLVLMQWHIRPASCVLNTHVELAGGPAHRLGYTFLYTQIYLLDHQQLPRY